MFSFFIKHDFVFKSRIYFVFFIVLSTSADDCSIGTHRHSNMN